MFYLLTFCIGFFFVTCWLRRVLMDLFVYLVVRHVPALQHDFKAHGPWALVTGSSGIPASYAEELAKRGINVVCLARKEHLLKNLVQQLKQYNVESCYALVDFSLQHTADSIATKLRDALKPFSSTASDPLDMVGTLVNCIGMANDEEWRYGWSALEDPNKTTMQVMNANFHSYSTTLGIFLPKFRARRTGGVAITVSSLCSNFSYPAITYAVSKVALRTFSAGLRGELQQLNRNVVVQTVNPGLVYTQLTSNFIDVTQRFKVGVYPKEYAAGAITTVGWLDETPGILSHAWHTYLILVGNTFVSERIMHALYYYFVKRYEGALEKRK